jgi:NTE family protein
MGFFNRRLVAGRLATGKKKVLNLTLGGGGIKGIAYAGVFEVAPKRGYKWGNIAGVSAGAVAGSYVAAGYRPEELLQVLEQFDFSEIDLNKIPEKVPVVQRIMELKDKLRQFDETTFRYLLTQKDIANMESEDYRAGFLKNIVTYTQKGCLFDGDSIEEWAWKTLSKKGVRTFGDLRGGIIDSKNPNGYKMRMTAVDCNRAKVIVLPDDISYYGINPDEFEVAKAIRMSTCVPFAFKPVEIKRKDGDKTKTHYIVDGGVLDKFPSWLIEDSKKYPKVGFTLDGGEKKGIFHMDTPLGILKALISVVHDIGVPKEQAHDLKHLGKIDTTKVYFLDFNINEEDKNYLYESGKKTAKLLFDEFEKTHGYKCRKPTPIFSPWFK